MLCFFVLFLILTPVIESWLCFRVSFKEYFEPFKFDTCLSTHHGN